MGVAFHHATCDIWAQRDGCWVYALLTLGDVFPELDGLDKRTKCFYPTEYQCNAVVLCITLEHIGEECQQRKLNDIHLELELSLITVAKFTANSKEWDELSR